MPIAALILDILSHIATFLNDVEMQIIKDKVTFDEDFYNHTVSSGYLNLLKWMPECYGDFDNMFEIAAEYGHLDVLIWAREHHNYSCGRWTHYRAICNDNLEILQWLHKNGYGINRNTCSYAAECGNLHILQWARANGCKYNANTLRCAMENGHIEIVNWLSANGMNNS